LLILSPIVGDRESPQSDELNQLMGPDPSRDGRARC
jgi:hypothetical protein